VLPGAAVSDNVVTRGQSRAGALQCVAVCCRVLQCVAVLAVCCRELQCVAGCCRVLQCVAVAV